MKLTIRGGGIAALAALGALALGTPVHAAPFAQPTAQQLTAGAVVALAGTPHLWIADEEGVLHWAGDTRVLADKTVEWSIRQDVGLEQLKSMQRGDPWLSAGLVKSGDPIYLVHWDSDQEQPTLLRIQSVSDLELFGITSANYDQLVLDDATWQQEFELATSTLTTGDLVGATGMMGPSAVPAQTVAPAQATALVAKKVDPSRIDDTTAIHTVDISGATPGTRLQVSGTYDEYEFESGGSTKRSFGPEDAGPVTAAGTLRWSRTHPVYTGAQYTFTDPAGNKVLVEFTGDI